MIERHYDCEICQDTGWREPIGPCSDGSYITMQPCRHCQVYNRQRFSEGPTTALSDD